MRNNLKIFGVRHLSPGASWHLLQYLEEHRPKCILIEGPTDAKDMLIHLAHKEVVPPVALLAYTTEMPIETVLYPFAEYSPEYQAIRWGIRHKSDVRFIDLPASVLLKLRQSEKDKNQEKASAYYAYHNDLYRQLAVGGDENDYESYWERNFEHNLQSYQYQKGLEYQSTSIRELVENEELEAVPYDYSYNHIREAHMCMEIERAISEGYQPEDIVIIVGAYHVSGIRNMQEPMTSQELKNLPVAPVNITLMPYSYHRLSSRTGYGAGNKAPFYFEMMWQSLQNDTLKDLSAVYMSKVARKLREQGYNASSASVIEAVRLADALSILRSGDFPVLQDLHDAAVTCLGGGELSVVASPLNHTDIGTAIGKLPEGVGQTPVQEDVNLELKRLKLTQYKSAVAQELSLDLRENLKVKSQEAAFIDLNRSVFLHRLQLLNIRFATPIRISQDSATWAEKWTLQWTPEVEIEIVEANLKGETLEIAAAYELKEKLSACEDVFQAAQLIRLACECNLEGIFENALSVLQQLLIDAANFKDTAHAARELSHLIQYGSLRRFDLEPLKPILQQLFLRASLLLIDASNCDDKAAAEILTAVNVMELISQEQYDLVDAEIWQAEIKTLAKRDDLNTKLSGVAFSILLEHNLVSEEDCAREVSRRLSPGVPADLGAGWFEGLSGRNRYALLSRVALWKELDEYVRSLDEEEFFRSVVFLRRAFGDFESNQKNSIAELLGDLWGTGAEATAETLQEELNEEEINKLDELSDFDFEF